jgi:uncharacterized repeat protein (TIGR03803 family)
LLHTFQGEPDGRNPQAGLIDVNGTLYGTTAYGGNGSLPFAGFGTVYKIAP